MYEIDVLEGMSVLVAECGDVELGRLLDRHDYQHLITAVKSAESLEEPADAELLHRLADDLERFSQEIWELAEAQGVPFHAHNLIEMAAFLARDPEATDLRETVYNLLGSAAITLSLKLLYRVATLQLAAQR